MIFSKSEKYRWEVFLAGEDFHCMGKTDLREIASGGRTPPSQ
jgi:hypothetical protein